MTDQTPREPKLKFAVGDRVQAREDLSYHGRVSAVFPDADPSLGEAPYRVRWDGVAGLADEFARDLMEEEG